MARFDCEDKPSIRTLPSLQEIIIDKAKIVQISDDLRDHLRMEEFP